MSMFFFFFTFFAFVVASKGILFEHLNFHPSVKITLEEYTEAVNEILNLIDEELAFLKQTAPTAFFLCRRYNYFFPGCSILKIIARSSERVDSDEFRGKYQRAEESLVFGCQDNQISLPQDGFIASTQIRPSKTGYVYEVSYVAFHRAKPNALIHKIIEYHLYVRKNDKIWPSLDKSLLSLASTHPSTIPLEHQSAVYCRLLTTLHHISTLMLMTVSRLFKILPSDTPLFIRQSSEMVFPYFLRVYFPSWSVTVLHVDEMDNIPLNIFKIGGTINLIKDKPFIVARPLGALSVNSSVFLLSAPQTATPIARRGTQLLHKYLHGELFDFKKLDVELKRASSGDFSSVSACFFNEIMCLMIQSSGKFMYKNVAYASNLPIITLQSLNWQKLKEQTHAKIVRHSSKASSGFESKRTRIRVYEQEALYIWRIILPSVRIITHDQITLSRKIACVNGRFLQPTLDPPKVAIIRFEDTSGFWFEEAGAFLESYTIDGEDRLMAIYPGSQIPPVTRELLERARHFGIDIDANE